MNPLLQVLRATIKLGLDVVENVVGLGVEEDVGEGVTVPEE